MVNFIIRMVCVIMPLAEDLLVAPASQAYVDGASFLPLRPADCWTPQQNVQGIGDASISEAEQAYSVNMVFAFSNACISCVLDFLC